LPRPRPPATRINSNELHESGDNYLDAHRGRYGPTPSKPLKTESQGELEQLRRELAKVKMERDMPKKALGSFAKRSNVKFGFIAEHRAVWKVRVSYSVLEVSSSGFYEWFGRQANKRA
jgi:hypothetical protein